MDAVILQGADHLQAGAVADVRQARVAMAAEVALQDSAISGAIEQRAPCFELADALRRFPGVEFGHAPVVEILAAAHGVSEVYPPVVAIVHVGEGRRDAALGHDGVGFAQKRFADDADLRAAGGGFNGGAQAGSACSDHQYVVRVPLEFGHLYDSPIVPDAHGTEADVDVGERHPQQAGPRPFLVVAVEPADPFVELVPDRVLRDLVEHSTDHVPECMTPEYIAAEEDGVYDQHQGPDADAEP